MNLAALLASTLLAAAPKPAVPLDEPPKYEDVAVKSRLKLVTDGKGHYLAFDPAGGFRGPLFFSADGKVFYLLRSSGGGSSADSFSASLWDPRIEWAISGYASFDWKEGKYSVSCPPKSTPLTVVAAEEATRLLEAAVLHQPKWQRQAHKLARDEKGTYYFVDCARDDQSRSGGRCERDWRLYLGQRGKMKLQQMTNIVHDSVGEIFATRTGELRLVLTDEQRAGPMAQRKDLGMKWVAGKVSSPLINVPIESNSRLIYTELGIYDREKLGTPCDEL